MEFPIHPVGTKPKRVLLCPAECRVPFLIPGHRYLFKVAVARRATQLWSEVIAYRIATLVGLGVPPCFVAVDYGKLEVGALVEFFYGYPDDTVATELIPAADLLQRFRRGRRTDRPHYVQLNLAICREKRSRTLSTGGRGLWLSTLSSEIPIVTLKTGGSLSARKESSHHGLLLRFSTTARAWVTRSPRMNLRSPPSPRDWQRTSNADATTAVGAELVIPPPHIPICVCT